MQLASTCKYRSNINCAVVTVQPCTFKCWPGTNLLLVSLSSRTTGDVMLSVLSPGTAQMPQELRANQHQGWRALCPPSWLPVLSVEVGALENNSLTLQISSAQHRAGNSNPNSLSGVPSTMLCRAAPGSVQGWEAKQTSCWWILDSLHSSGGWLGTVLQVSQVRGMGITGSCLTCGTVPGQDPHTKETHQQLPHT